MQIAAGAEAQNLPTWRRVAVLLSGFFTVAAGLSTIFVLVMTAAQAWQEHNQAQWPATMAQVQSCSLDIYTYQSDAYWINCSVSYQVNSEKITSRVHSLTISSPRGVIGQNPSGQFDRMQAWVDVHPEGTPIKVHYDPVNYGKAVLVETDMPRGGPQAPNGLKLLGYCAASFVLILAISRIVRSRTDVQGCE
jgi:hypothetical protein